MRDLDVDYTQSRLERLSDNELRSVKVSACADLRRGWWWECWGIPLRSRQGVCKKGGNPQKDCCQSLRAHQHADYGGIPFFFLGVLFSGVFQNGDGGCSQKTVCKVPRKIGFSSSYSERLMALPVRCCPQNVPAYIFTLLSKKGKTARQAAAAKGAMESAIARVADAAPPQQSPWARGAPAHGQPAHLPSHLHASSRADNTAAALHTPYLASHHHRHHHAVSTHAPGSTFRHTAPADVPTSAPIPHYYSVAPPPPPPFPPPSHAPLLALSGGTPASLHPGLPAHAQHGLYVPLLDTAHHQFTPPLMTHEQLLHLQYPAYSEPCTSQAYSSAGAYADLASSSSQYDAGIYLQGQLLPFASLGLEAHTGAAQTDAGFYC